MAKETEEEAIDGEGGPGLELGLEVGGVGVLLRETESGEAVDVVEVAESAESSRLRGRNGEGVISEELWRRW